MTPNAVCTPIISAAVPEAVVTAARARTNDTNISNSQLVRYALAHLAGMDPATAEELLKQGGHPRRTRAA